MKTWNFGLIGCGSVADFHIEAIRQIEEAVLRCVSSRNEAKSNRLLCRKTVNTRLIITS